MKTLLVLAAALDLAACGQPKTAGDESGAADTCTAQATRTWRIGGEIYRLDATAHGATCAGAQATLVLRAPGGAVIYTASFATADIPLSFNPNAADSSALNDDINLWIENQAPGSTARALPAWPASADKPPQFRPSVTHDVYEAARASADPIYCFPDSGEGHACRAGNPPERTATRLGRQTPGTP